jgi:hypothetical protein
MLSHFHVHSLQCLETGQQPLQERVRHKVSSNVSSFSFQYLLSSLRSASSCLRLLFLLIPSILPSVTCLKKTDGIGHILHSNCPPYKLLILDFELSPCSECCILSFGLYPGFWILYVDVSEHSVSSIFIDAAYRLHRLCRWNRVFRKIGI